MSKKHSAFPFRIFERVAAMCVSSFLATGSKMAGRLIYRASAVSFCLERGECEYKAITKIPPKHTAWYLINPAEEPKRSTSCVGIAFETQNKIGSRNFSTSVPTQTWS